VDEVFLLLLLLVVVEMVICKFEVVTSSVVGIDPIKEIVGHI
jgi:hypothetical protein